MMYKGGMDEVNPDDLREAVLAILQREKELEEKEQEAKKKNHGFVMVFDTALTSALQLVASKSGQAIQLWMFLGAYMDRQGAVCCSNEIMAEALNIAPQNIPRLLKILRDFGVIWTIRGAMNVHCMNPEVAWRAGANGKEYALFNTMAITHKSEYVQARDEAKRRAENAHRVVQDRLKKVRGLVVRPSPQQHFEPPVGPDPAVEAELEPVDKVPSKAKGPGLKIKRPTKVSPAPKGK